MSNTQHPPIGLKASVKYLCEQPQLNDQQLNQLLDLQDDLLGSSSSQPQSKPSLSVWMKSTAAALFVAIGLVFWLLQPKDYSEQIAYEVVKNHLKLKPLDIQTQSMGDIKTFFTQLDFAPVSSNVLATHFELADSFLLGGRYCSIKGITAAQLRYEKESLSTVYQVPYDEELHGDIPSTLNGETPLSLDVKGLNVQLWQEKGLLIVWVGS